MHVQTKGVPQREKLSQFSLVCEALKLSVLPAMNCAYVVWSFVEENQKQQCMLQHRFLTNVFTQISPY